MHERSVMEVYEKIPVGQISDDSSQSNSACLPDIKTCYYCKSLVPKENAKLHNCFHYCKSKKEYSCLICWRVFHSPLELTNHTENISEYYSCSSCRKFFQKDHSCESPLKVCAFCKKSVKDIFSHRCFHQRTQKDFENLKGKQETTCGICRMRMPKKLMFEHYKGHTHTECEICGKSVPKTMLRFHKYREHQRVECDSCEKYFENKVDYSKHKEKEHLARVCHICGKKFTTSISLRRHMVVCQNDDPQFKCKSCGKSFAAPEYLRRHMLVHTTEGKHQCTTCNKKFKNRYNMRVHMRIHDAIKPFECSICHKTFTTKQWRDSHMKTHRD